MIRKFNRWLRGKTGKRVIAGSLALLFVVIVVGQLLGWWSDVLRYLQGTIDPSQVVMASFEAVVADGEVVLSWETETELNNWGFDLYRHQDGPFIRLNQDLIPSKASESASYEFVDSDVVAGTVYYYWIESVDRYGFRTHQGSLVVEMQDPGSGSVLSDGIFLPLVLVNSP